MCLVAAAWRSHSRFRLVLIANRDEFFERPASAAAIWPEAPTLLAGRDLSAGGSWLGVDQLRRVAVITNYRELARPRRNAASRGRFVPDFLRGQLDAGAFLNSIEIDATSFAGFSLLLADSDQFWFASNRADRFARPLPPGLYGLANHLLDTPWPKLLRLRSRLADWLAESARGAEPDLEALFGMLADRQTAHVPAQLHSGLPPDAEAALSAAFVHFGTYGTRCSTVLLLGHDGELWFEERRFDPAGTCCGKSEFQLNAGRWAA